MKEAARYSVVLVNHCRVDRFSCYRRKRDVEIGNFHRQFEKNPSSEENLSLNSFEFIRSLGKGGYGSVFLVRRIETNEFLALKAIRKSDLIETNEEQIVFSERKLAASLKHPNIVKTNSFVLSFCFSSPKEIFRSRFDSRRVSKTTHTFI